MSTYKFYRNLNCLPSRWLHFSPSFEILPQKAPKSIQDGEILGFRGNMSMGFLLYSIDDD